MPQQRPQSPFSALLWRVAVLTLLWGVLANNAGWHFGTVVILAAILASLAFAPTPLSQWSLGLWRFLIHFCKESLLGGADVAYRALHPALPLQPGWLNYPLRLPQGPGRVLFACTVNLQPGTLSAELEGDNLIVHLLVDSAETRIRLEALEERIAALFTTPLVAPPAEETKHE